MSWGRPPRRPTRRGHRHRPLGLRPVDSLGRVGLAAQLLQHPVPRAVPAEPGVSDSVKIMAHRVLATCPARAVAGAIVRAVDPLLALELASELLAQRLQLVSPQSLGTQSACPGWTVFDLVNHVNGGGHRYLMLLQGASAGDVDATRGEDHVGQVPVDCFWAWQRPLTREFASDGALARTVHHPLGDRSGEDLLGMRLLDLTLHAWDLSRSLTLDERLDPALVSYLLPHQMHLVEQLRAVGAYGVETSGPFSDPQAELLRRTGRATTG